MSESSPLAPEWTLIERVLQGDPKSLDSWYRAEFPSVWRLAIGVLLRAEEAEDLAQEAMLKLHDRLSAWDPKRAYAPWRNTLVLNLCRDRLRRMDARRRAESEAASEESSNQATSPSARMEQGELRRLLHSALAQLSPREREAFVLRELENHPSEEVAAAMGIEVASLRSLLTLARRRLREYLGRTAPELIGGEHAS